MADVKERLVLITGCGRSGTTYISNVLRKAGLGVKHERVGSHGTASWYFAVNDTAPVLPHEKHKRHANGETRGDFCFEVVLHQVRHPLKVIASAKEILHSKDWLFIAKHIGVHPGLPPLNRGMRYWLWWNAKVARMMPEHTYRIEDIEAEWPTICRLLGMPAQPLPDVSREMNSATGHLLPKPLSWGALEAMSREPGMVSAVRRQAELYGYE